MDNGSRFYSAAVRPRHIKKVIDIGILAYWHPVAMRQLDRLALRVAKETCIDKNTASKHMYERLSVCLQRLNASSLISRQPYFVPSHVYSF